MRRALAITLLTALTVSAVGQVWPAVCPLQASGAAAAPGADRVMGHCGAMKLHLRQRGSEVCLSSHQCCRLAPDQGQLLLARDSSLQPGHEEIGTGPAPAMIGPVLRSEIQLSIHDFVVRPPVEKLKTELRI